MSILDGVILVLYMIGIVAFGAFLGKENETDEDYFAGGRSMPWYALGLSVGLTMISANSFIGGPGWAYTDGLIAAMVNISVPLTIVFCTYTILPVIYNARVTTVYEYVYMRLGTKSRILNVIAWLAQSIVFIGGFVYTPSLVLDAITGIPQDIWVPIIVVLTILLTVAGGLKAVIWTDMIQGIILFIGLVIGVTVATGALDMPIGDAWNIAREAGITTSFDFSFAFSGLNFWTAMLGGFFMWVGYFGFDQGQVQRYVSAKDMKTIKKTGVMSSIAMQVIYWLCFILGTFLFVFYQSNPNTLDFANSNNVMTDFLLNYVPTGVLGLLLAATFAAAMSSIDSVLNSLTAVFVKDLYEPYIVKRQGTSLKQSMIFTVIFGVIVVIFVYAGLSDNMASILQTIGTLTAPFGSVLSGMLFVCCFMKSANDNGTFIGALLSAAIQIYLSTSGLVADIHYLWGYVYGALMVIVFAWIFSKIFYKEEDAKARYKYTIYGTIEDTKGKTDANGSSLEPLKMDVYGIAMIVVFAVQCVILVALQ